MSCVSIEASPVIYLLLENAISRLKKSSTIDYHWQLMFANSLSYLQNIDDYNQPDVIYLDSHVP